MACFSSCDLVSTATSCSLKRSAQRSFDPPPVHTALPLHSTFSLSCCHRHFLLSRQIPEFNCLPEHSRVCGFPFMVGFRIASASRRAFVNRTISEVCRYFGEGSVLYLTHKAPSFFLLNWLTTSQMRRTNKSSIIRRRSRRRAYAHPIHGRQRRFR